MHKVIHALLFAILGAIPLTAQSTVLISLDMFVTDVAVTNGDGVLMPDDVAEIGDILILTMNLPISPIVGSSSSALDGLDLSINGLMFTGFSPAFNYDASSFSLDSDVGGSGSLMAGGGTYSLSGACCGTSNAFGFAGPYSPPTTPVELIDVLTLVDNINGSVVGEFSAPGGGVIGVSINYSMTPVPLPAGLLLFTPGFASLLLVRRGGRFARFNPTGLCPNLG